MNLQPSYKKLNNNDFNSTLLEVTNDENQYFTPKDNNNLIYISFLIMGLTTLIPWNAILATADYWILLIPDHDMLNYYVIVYQTCNLAGFSLSTKYGHLVSLKIKVVASFTAYAILLAIMPFIKNWVVSMILCGLLGLFNSFASGAIFGLAALCDPLYISAVMSGQGVCGIFIAILRCICKVSFSVDDEGTKNSAYMYFAIAISIIGLAISCYFFVLAPSPLFHHYLAKGERATLKAESETLSTNSDSSAEDRKGSLYSYYIVLLKIWPMALCVFTVFFVSLSLFPTITNAISSSNEFLNSSKWYLVISFTLFCLGDLIGRSAPSFSQLIFFNQTGVIINVIIRFIYFPLFIFMLPNHLVDFLNHDFWNYIIMMLFSMTNGYFGTLSMMFASDSVLVEEKEKSGLIMITFLTVGLTLGVWNSTLLVNVLKVPTN